MKELIVEMRASAEAMRGGPVKGALLRWAERLEAALTEEAASEQPQSSPAPSEALHGIYDNRVTGFRETYAHGVLQSRTTSAFCPRNHPWGKYEDVPR